MTPTVRRGMELPRPAAAVHGGDRTAHLSPAAPGRRLPVPSPRERCRQRGRHRPPPFPLFPPPLSVPQPHSSAALLTHLGGTGGIQHRDTCLASPGQSGTPAQRLYRAACRAAAQPARPGPARGAAGAAPTGRAARGSREGRPDRAGGAEALRGAVLGRCFPTPEPVLTRRSARPAPGRVSG